MKHAIKTGLFYTLAVLYTLIYLPCAVLAVPHILIGNLLDTYVEEPFAVTFRGLFVNLLRYDIGSIRERIFGREFVLAGTVTGRFTGYDSDSAPSLADVAPDLVINHDIGGDAQSRFALPADFRPAPYDEQFDRYDALAYAVARGDE